MGRRTRRAGFRTPRRGSALHRAAPASASPRRGRCRPRRGARPRAGHRRPRAAAQRPRIHRRPPRWPVRRPPSGPPERRGRPRRAPAGGFSAYGLGLSVRVGQRDCAPSRARRSPGEQQSDDPAGLGHRGRVGVPRPAIVQATRVEEPQLVTGCKGGGIVRHADNGDPHVGGPVGAGGLAGRAKPVSASGTGVVFATSGRFQHLIHSPWPSNQSAPTGSLSPPSARP